MRNSALIMMAGLVGVTMSVAVIMGGCAVNPLQIPIDFSLGEGLGTFDAQAGVATENKGTTSWQGSDVTAGSGAIEIPPTAITVIPADSGGGKGRVNLQETQELEITVWLAPVDEIDTVCGGGEQYGPFIVELDDNYAVLSVDPSRVNLTQNTLDLLNGGSFSICVRVVSPIDATVVINNLTFRVGL